MLPALVLTPWMSPHRIVNWQEAVTLVFLRKAEALEEHAASVSSPSVTIQLPAVLRLKMHVAREKRDVKFSRVNVYQRDGHRCQYCGEKFPPAKLSYDHVIPRARGGQTTWENIVTACKRCNLKKGHHTLQQAGMKLLKKPARPKSLPLVQPLALPREVPELWLPYLESDSRAAAG